MSLTKVAAAMIGGGTSGTFAPSVPIYENTNTVSVNCTITTGSNAMSAGPITIADGVTVTIPDGSYWVIV